MKRNGLGAGFALVLLLVAAASLLGAAVRLSGESALYGSLSRSAVEELYRREGREKVTREDITGAIGLDEDSQEEVARELAAFMREESETLPRVLGDKEVQHMWDVRRLMSSLDRLSRGMLLVSGIGVLLLALCRNSWREATRALLAGAVLAGLVVAVSVLAGGILGFTRLFVLVHRVAFDNQLWMMDPETQILIRMMPSTLFEHALHLTVVRALSGMLITLALLTGVYVLVHGMTLRNLQAGGKE